MQLNRRFAGAVAVFKAEHLCVLEKFLGCDHAIEFASFNKMIFPTIDLARARRPGGAKPIDKGR